MTTSVDVLIATPGHSLMAAYVNSLLDTTRALDERGISWKWLNGYASHVGDAREVTLAGTMQNEVDEQRPLRGQVDYRKVIWIDSDIAWSPDDFLRLYESDFDVVSGAYLLATGEVTAYPELLGPGLRYEDVLAMSEPTRVYGVGLGFVAVKPGIFEKLSRPWFQSVPVTVKNTDTGDSWTFPIMGEDLSWCKRVNDLGFEIWLDPTVRVTHHKMMTLSWEGIRP